LTKTTAETAVELLREVRKIVLVGCVDPRIRGNLARSVCRMGFVGTIYRQTYPGSSLAIIKPERKEANIANIGDIVSMGAELVVLAHHGMICRAYGKNQDQQITDLFRASSMVGERLGVPVIALWQDNPSVPQVEVMRVVL